MALEQSIVMGIALAYLFIRALEQSEREQQRRERLEDLREARGLIRCRATAIAPASDRLLADPFEIAQRRVGDSVGVTTPAARASSASSRSITSRQRTASAAASIRAASFIWSPRARHVEAAVVARPGRPCAGPRARRC